MPGEDSLLERFRIHVTEKAFWRPHDKLFLACSGGVDSMVLAHLLKTTGYGIEILHCNFNLRGEESLRDESFIRSFASTTGTPFQITSFETARFMQEWGMGVQETARKLRYDWFRKVISSIHPIQGKAYVLTAHHADDLAETMLINFLRGTGLAGLHGIPEKTDCFVRPLLFASRKEIMEHAVQHALAWVDDSSNTELHYTRNFIRGKILPELESVFPAVRQNLVSNAKRLGEAEQLYRMQVQKIRTSLLKEINGQTAVPVSLISKSIALDTILHEIFSPFGFSAAQCEEIKKLLDAPTGKWVESSSHRVLKNRNWLLIEALAEKDFSVHVIDQDTSALSTPQFKLTFSTPLTSAKVDADPSKAWLDASRIVYPLILRKWKEGDYFYPLGMKKKKKVARFMTDLKLSRFEKENQWVMLSGSKIVWVLGRRIDDRFKVMPGTKETLLVSLHS